MRTRVEQDCAGSTALSGTGNQAFGVNGLGPAAIAGSTITGTAAGGALGDAVISQTAGITVSVDDSRLTATTYVMGAYAGSILTAGSEINGVAAHNAGAVTKCVTSYNAAYDPVSAACV